LLEDKVAEACENEAGCDQQALRQEVAAGDPHEACAPDARIECLLYRKYTSRRPMRGVTSRKPVPGIVVMACELLA